MTVGYPAPTFSGITLNGDFAGNPNFTGAPTGDFSSLLALATGTTVKRTFADHLADRIHAADFGVKANGSDDDTAALQRAINYCQGYRGRKLILPHGIMPVTGLTITNLIAIEGEGQWASIIQLKAGSTVAAITGTITSTAWNNNALLPYISLRGFSILGASQNDGPGQGVAHGLYFPTNGTPHQPVHAFLENLSVCGVAADGIRGLAGSTCQGTNVDVQYVGGAGVNLNSCTDVIWTGGNLYGAGGNGTPNHNLIVSGCLNMRFDRMNIFSATGHDVYVFNSQAVFVNSILDFTGQDNLHVVNTGGQRLDFLGCTFEFPGSQTNNTYTSINMTSVNTGDVYLTGCWLRSPANSPSGNKPLNNINFDPANTGKVYCANVAFELGAATTAGVTNNANLIVSKTTNDLAVTRNLSVAGNTVFSDYAQVQSASQFKGYHVNNGTNDVALMNGNTSTNDGGTLTLLLGGVPVIVISANGGSFINTPLYMGNGVSSPTPVQANFHGVDASGANVAGAGLGFLAGRGTGSGAGGDVVFQVAPPGGAGSGSNNWAEGFRVRNGGGVAINGGPSWTSGAGAPGGVQPVGSLYSNTSGATGSRLYVSAGGGTWAAVAGV